jgi:hypothetical protein
MRKLSAFAIATAAGASAHAQLSPGGELRFEVWNGSQWSLSTNASPGSTVQWRAMVTYTGTNTTVLGLGSIRYQPTFSNAINSGDSPDMLSSYANGGQQGNALPNSIANAGEGTSPAMPANGYGRVTYGATANNNILLSTLTNFRHGGGVPQNNAPDGSWLRIAGSSVVNWPDATVPGTSVTAVQLNNIARGVAANQNGPFIFNPAPESHFPNTLWVPGTQRLVIFRGAITLSNETAGRDMVISSAEGSLNRVGGTTADRDQRFMSWINDIKGGTLRTSVDVIPAQIFIPSPGTLVLAAAGLVVVRQQRPKT